MAVYEYKTQNATVRFHDGRLSEEERTQVIQKAAERFFRAILPELQRLGLEDRYTIKPETPEEVRPA